MARPKKKGLDYFPLDVDIFEDEKLFDVQEKYGPLGEVIYLRLLCLIYKNGYYYKFDSLDKLAAIVIRSIGNRWTRNKQAVKEVILYLAECNLLSSELMRRNVITARSIQQRYLKALERNQPEINEYSLIGEKSETDTGLITAPENLISDTETRVFATETRDNVCNNDTKEKERKVKEIKEDISADTPRTTHTDYRQITELYNSICVSLPKVNSLSEARKKAISARLKSYTLSDFETVFRKAEASSFLKGKNNRDWSANFDWLMKDSNFAKTLDGNYDDRGGTNAGTDTDSSSRVYDEHGGYYDTEGNYYV